VPESEAASSDSRLAAMIERAVCLGSSSLVMLEHADLRARRDLPAAVAFALIFAFRTATCTLAYACHVGAASCTPPTPIPCGAASPSSIRWYNARNRSRSRNNPSSSRATRGRTEERMTRSRRASGLPTTHTPTWPPTPRRCASRELRSTTRGSSARQTAHE